MHLGVQIGHFQTIFAVTANFTNDAAAHNSTSHILDKFLLKQELTHSVLEDAAYLQSDMSLTIEVILLESLLGLNFFPLMLFFFSLAVRKGYRIQTDKERDSMKVLYYVEKELAQFDPARRMRERCEEQAWFDFFFLFTDLKKALQIHS